MIDYLTYIPEQPPCQHMLRAQAALETMAQVLPCYREVCGEVSYYYAANEVQRLKHEVLQASPDELVLITESVVAQTLGLAWAIRRAKGNGVEPDA